MAQLQIDIGETVSVKRDYRAKVPPFNAVCNGKKPFNGVKGMNPVPFLIDLNGKTASFFWSLYEIRDENTNVSSFNPVNHTEANKVSKWYKELNSIGFIKRIKPKTYMINPYMFLPKFEKFDIVKDKWDQLP